MLSFDRIEINDFNDIDSYKKQKKESGIKSSILLTKKQPPWVDKYRPKNLDEVIGQKEVISIIRKSGETGDLPHLILYGPPGTGKTSTILAGAMELFGPNILNERVIELNASDERGIKVVRNKITDFARLALGNSDPDYPSPPFKIVILDEADAMTSEAQAALRKIMEEYSYTTRFCFICNYINQIIDPIISRCMKFRFKPVEDIFMKDKLLTISKNENINLDEKIIKIIINHSKGDARKAIMILQNLKYMSTYKKNKDENLTVTSQDINNMIGTIPIKKVEKLWNYIKNHQLSDNLRILDKFHRNGYPINSFIKVLISIINKDISIDEQKKNLIYIHLANTEKKLLDGGNEYLQLMNIISYCKGVINNEVKDVSYNYY